MLNMSEELNKHLVLEQFTLRHELRDDINRLLTANTIELHKMRMLELPVTNTRLIRMWLVTKTGKINQMLRGQAVSRKELVFVFVL